jgi:4-hydroxy-tetrahydrodipicolinate synthase
MASKNNFVLRGSVVPLITPLDADEQLDVAAVDRLVAFQRDQGTDALFLLGSCGEGPCLIDPVRQALVERVLGLMAGLPVLVGVAETATKRALSAARTAARAGVDALVLMMPIFHWLKNPLEMIDHTQAVYDATGKPIILYNFPGKTDGVAIPPDIVGKLREKGIIIGIKDSSGDMAYLQKLISLRQQVGGLGVMNGEMRTAYDALRLGADGLVMSYTNVEPDKCRELIAAVQAGDYARGEALQKRMMTAWNEFAPTVNPVMKVKSILGARGLCRPVCCAPVRHIEPMIPKILQET